MLAAVDYRNNMLGIYDTEDSVIEWYTPLQIKQIIKKTNLEIMGVSLDEKCNPIYTLDGLIVNLAYKYTHNSTIIGRFMFIILEEGEKWGRTFSSVIKRTTVAVFDLGSSNFPKMVYPCGQYITSYYAETLLSHKDGYGLQFDTSVDSWKISARDMQELKGFLRHQL